MASDFPWKDAPDVIACNLAFGDLVNNLPRLTVEGRVHAETLLASIRVVAGFAAQRAFFAEPVESQGQAAREIQIATTASGGKFVLQRRIVRSSGEIGCGKSTLATDHRCLCREYVHTQGPVRPWSGSRDRYRHGDRDLHVKLDPAVIEKP